MVESPPKKIQLQSWGVILPDWSILMLENQNNIAETIKQSSGAPGPAPNSWDSIIHGQTLSEICMGSGLPTTLPTQSVWLTNLSVCLIFLYPKIGGWSSVLCDKLLTVTHYLGRRKGSSNWSLRVNRQLGGAQFSWMLLRLPMVLRKSSRHVKMLIAVRVLCLFIKGYTWIFLRL